MSIINNIIATRNSIKPIEGRLFTGRQEAVSVLTVTSLTQFKVWEFTKVRLAKSLFQRSPEQSDPVPALKTMMFGLISPAFSRSQVVSEVRLQQ